MRAVLLDAPGAQPRLADVPEPVCPADGVVVQVEATGVCRSDWHAWQGHDDSVTFPHVPGHELAGTLVEVGSDVRRWAVGDRVTVPFVCACGTCAACLAGEQQVCERQQQPGFTHAGSFAERVALHHADVNLVRLPDGLSPVTAAALGCRFATSYRAVTVHGRVEADQWVLVLGCGGVGLSAVMVAASRGARVLAVDVRASARQAAHKLGATEVLDPRSLATGLRVARRGAGSAGASPSLGSSAAGGAGPVSPEALAARVVELTGGGAHVGIDAIGHPDAVVTSVLSLRRRGRHVQVGLLLGPHARTALPMDRVVAWELELVGSHGMAAHAYPPMLAEVVSGALHPEYLVGRVVGLEEAPAALAALGAPGGAGGITVIAP